MYIPSTYQGKKVSTIAEKGFAGSATIRVISIPNTVTKIGNYAFQNCTNLSVVVGGESIEEIGGFAFYGIPFYHMSSADAARGEFLYYGFNLPNIKTIGNYAFGHTTSYLGTDKRTINVGTDLTYIGSNVFPPANGNHTYNIINYAGTKQQWKDNVTVGGTLNYVEVVCTDGVIRLQ